MKSQLQVLEIVGKDQPTRERYLLNEIAKLHEMLNEKERDLRICMDTLDLISNKLGGNNKQSARLMMIIKAKEALNKICFLHEKDQDRQDL